MLGECSDPSFKADLFSDPGPPALREPQTPKGLGGVGGLGGLGFKGFGV